MSSNKINWSYCREVSKYISRQQLTVGARSFGMAGTQRRVRREMSHSGQAGDSTHSTVKLSRILGNLVYINTDKLNVNH